MNTQKDSSMLQFPEIPFPDVKIKLRSITVKPTLKDADIHGNIIVFGANYAYLRKYTANFLEKDLGWIPCQLEKNKSDSISDHLFMERCKDEFLEVVKCSDYNFNESGAIKEAAWQGFFAAKKIERKD